MSEKGFYRLATAVLIQAIQDALSYSVGRRTSALRWINSDQQDGFSFSFVCRVVNRDPREIRRFCEQKIAEQAGPEGLSRSLGQPPGWRPVPAQSLTTAAAAGLG